jgi:hypothetical protein
LSVEALNLERHKNQVKKPKTGDFNRMSSAMITLREGILDLFLEYLI